MGKYWTVVFVTAAILFFVGCSHDGQTTVEETAATESRENGGGEENSLPAGGKAPANPEPVVSAFDPWCGPADCQCSDGSVQNYPTGTLEKCELSEATEIQGTLCGATNVHFAADGRLLECFPDQDVEIAGVPCGQRRYVRFHPSGGFKACLNSLPAVIDGISCGAWSGIELHPDGSLRRCQLAEPTTIAGFALPDNLSVTLSEGGTVVRVDVFGEPLVLGEISCTGNMNFFHPNGQVAKCKLGNTVQLASGEKKAGSWACFDDSGETKDCSSMSFDLT